MDGTSQPSTVATAENASSFIGDWTQSAQGPQGPAEFALTLKVDAGFRNEAFTELAAELLTPSHTERLC